MLVGCATYTLPSATSVVERTIHVFLRGLGQLAFARELADRQQSGFVVRGCASMVKQQWISYRASIHVLSYHPLNKRYSQLLARNN
ncbi:hypothetical protein Y032_0009g511 [Ancylostoma ceylanicum]|uniref:Uncharacterized protein n=1 Tax=Ancylostoma ceylanicum TaxID=53326 RepID=A0A016VHM4_9BILA|nr:hypothetical protein Y032_0009g511 [Ancylostoma ceylanicum]